MSTILYRVSAVLLVLFAAGHQLGFRRTDPRWNAGHVVDAMQNVNFDINGFERTYWSFFTGFGFYVTALLLFSALTAWALGRPGAVASSDFALLRWALAGCYVVIAAITWRYFFLVPGLFATVVAACLVGAAISAG